MKNALILHGTGNDNQDNWYPWLKKQLNTEGFNVFLPNLPEPNRPILKNWVDLIYKNWQFDATSLIVGHSSGGLTAFTILERLPQEIKVKLTISVSAFRDPIGWDILKNFFDEKYDWDKIKNSSEKIILFHSDNDPYVPLGHAPYLKEKLEADLVLIKNAGHFNTKSGYSQFPELLEKIKKNYYK